MCPHPRYTDPHVVLSNINSSHFPMSYVFTLGLSEGRMVMQKLFSQLIFPKALEPTCISKKEIYRGLHMVTHFFSKVPAVLTIPLPFRLPPHCCSKGNKEKSMRKYKIHRWWAMGLGKWEGVSGRKRQEAVRYERRIKRERRKRKI